ncbi:hypothetical protein Dsin_008288 [Dipteronia sinensis]|uniref:Uncharacterized protein n=1 Tax=Dipteronia sinensis TaxID=43782 RepID=A0AAE0ANE1_9ROSI|nr:hypothetical protein Dsin_008288 [Dipteronia sinensis]
MEAGKKTSEQQLHKDKDKKKSEEEAKVGPSPKNLLRESIITNTDDTNKDNKSSGVAENPEDVLAFSRSVHKIDSSLD